MLNIARAYNADNGQLPVLDHDRYTIALVHGADCACNRVSIGNLCAFHGVAVIHDARVFIIIFRKFGFIFRDGIGIIWKRINVCGFRRIGIPCVTIINGRIHRSIGLRIYLCVRLDFFSQGNSLSLICRNGVGICFNALNVYSVTIGEV